MKKTILLLALCCLSLSGNAQNESVKKVSVEKSIFGIQTGLLGIWVHHEARLSNKFVLRSEIGFDGGLFSGSNYDNLDFLMTPVITLEPRFYYNLNKRVAKQKNISGNSGNFLSIKTTYHPDWFVISSNDDVNVPNQMSIIPTWGIRRNIGKHFNYETGVGLGYIHYFPVTTEYYKIEASGEVTLNIHARIGYRF